MNNIQSTPFCYLFKVQNIIKVSIKDKGKMRVRIMAKLQGENKPGLYSKSVSASNLVCIPKTERLRVRVLHLGSRIYL